MRLQNRIAAVLVMALAACVLLLVFSALRSNPKPILLTVTRTTQERGSPVALLEVTNQTKIGFNESFWTEVLSNGVWVDAAAQPQDARMAAWLAPHRGRTLEVPV